MECVLLEAVLQETPYLEAEGRLVPTEGVGAGAASSRGSRAPVQIVLVFFLSRVRA